MRKVILALIPFAFATPALAVEGSIAPVNPAAAPIVASEGTASVVTQPRTHVTHDTVGGRYDALIAAHAAANGVPETLIRRIIRRESGGRAGVVSKGNYGLMQIKLATARGVGYTGTAAGLLDPNTNMTYAVKYLAGAYRAARGNESRAVAYYASGYYNAAKRQGAFTSAVAGQPAAAPSPSLATAAAVPKTALGEATPIKLASAETAPAMNAMHRRHHRR